MSYSYTGYFYDSPYEHSFPHQQHQEPIYTVIDYFRAFEEYTKYVAPNTSEMNMRKGTIDNCPLKIAMTHSSMITPNELTKYNKLRNIFLEELNKPYCQPWEQYRKMHMQNMEHLPNSYKEYARVFIEKSNFSNVDNEGDFELLFYIFEKEYANEHHNVYRFIEENYRLDDRKNYIRYLL